jgi:hypothetical protein
MPIEHLTELQYSSDRKGPFALVIYEPDSQYHAREQWFRNVPKYPDEEISSWEALQQAQIAVAARREVRVCDGGDRLVYHAKDGKVLYGEKFWEEIAGVVKHD